jgi:hypothetical protein
VTSKALYDGSATGGRTLLVRVDPNCPFPQDGGEPEHIYLIEGELWAGPVRMRAGDHRFAPAGTAHHDLRGGRTGALFVLMTR